MAVVINTNVDSTKIQGLLNNSTTNLSKTMQRLSSGLKILSAKDDAAGTVISARMEVQLNGTKIAQNNVQNANALLSTAEGNLDVIQDNISRIRDLTLQAKNGTYSEDEIQAMQDEVQERINEINRISSSAKFSSLRLFGDNTGLVPAQPKGLALNGATFQVGPNAGEDNVIKADQSLFQSVEFSAMTGARNFDLTKIADPTKAAEVTYGNNGVDKTDIDAATNNFDKAILALDEAIDDITSRKSIIGSAGNRMDSAYDALVTQSENLTSAKSLITDADIASEASGFTQYQILQQVSTSLLAQANQAPSIALSLV